MATEVIMPKLGMGMEKGRVVQWMKETGQSVAKGDILVVISSDKIEIEVESPADGVLLNVIVPEGEEVPVGTVIGYVGEEGEQIKQEQNTTMVTSDVKVAQEVAAGITTEKALAGSPPANKIGPDKEQKQGKKSVRMSPLARKLAREAGLDVEQIEGTGPKGRVTREDVERAIEQLKKKDTVSKTDKKDVFTADQTSTGYSKTPVSTSSKPVTGMRQVIAERMMDSLRNSAQLTLTARVDVTDLLNLKETVSKELWVRDGIKVTMTAFIARAVVIALERNPVMNSVWQDGRIVENDQIHLGLAVALEKGLVVPVIRQANHLTIGELARQIANQSEKARGGTLSLEEMRGSTFTITNLGGYGIEWFTPILNPPETGILGVGATQPTPLFIDDQLQQREVMPLSLTFDHRVLDGAPAARFLSEVKYRLEHPHTLLI